MTKLNLTKINLIKKLNNRKSIIPSQQEVSFEKQASVLVPIIAENPLTLLFTERTAHLTHHASQISFPGGRRDTRDASLEATCLRETVEEIGIDSDQIEILSHLPTLMSSSGLAVTPFVGLIHPPLNITINPAEVANLFMVPLDFLLDPGNHQQEIIQFQGQSKTVYVIQYQNYKIWGLTAKIIIDLVKALY